MTWTTWGLNAPYGAPRFLISRPGQRRWQAPDVLMHLMVLRAFSRQPSLLVWVTAYRCLNAPYGAPCFLTLRL